MSTESQWYLDKVEDNEVYGPLSLPELQGLADSAMVSPQDLVSTDKETWSPAIRLPALGMVYLLELQPGRFYGPTTRGTVGEFVHDRVVAPGALVVDLRDGRQYTAGGISAVAEAAEKPPAPSRQYSVFISYRHADNIESGRQWATWLHHSLETYELPPDVVGRKNLRGGQVNNTLFPVFRDEEELSANSDLSSNIRAALARSTILVVICSPRAAASRFVAEEIRCFKELGGSDRILALLVDGEPNCADDGQKQRQGFGPELECLPEPLRFGVPREDGSIDWSARTEPIAADARPGGRAEQGWTSAAAYREALNTDYTVPRSEIDDRVRAYEERLELARLKIIAGAIGVPLGELTQREKAYQLKRAQARARKLRILAACFAFLAVLAGGAAWVAVKQRAAAQASELAVRKAAASAQFTAAADWIRQEQGAKALPHLARSLHIDPHNDAAALRLLSLLGQRHWPVAMREFKSEFGVRQLLLHPDQQRLVVSSAFDAYEVKGTAAVHVWNWQNGRLLSAPDLVSRNDSTGLVLAQGGSLAAVQRLHKSFESTSFIPIPPVDAPPLTIPADRTEHDTYNHFRLHALRDDGQIALVHYDGGSFDDREEPARYLLAPTTTDRFSPKDKELTQLVSGTLAEGQKFAGGTIYLPLEKDDECATAWFEGQLLYFLSRSGHLVVIDPALHYAQYKAQWPIQGAGIKLATRATASGKVAILGTDETLTVRKSPEGTTMAGPIPIASAGPWKGKGRVEVIERMEFCQNEQVLQLLYGEEGYRQKRPQAFWRLAPEPAAKLEWLPLGHSLLDIAPYKQTSSPEVFAEASTGRPIAEPLQHESEVTAATLLNDYIFATGTAQGLTRVWTRSEALWKVPASEKDTLEPEKSLVLAVSPDGKRKLIGEGETRRRNPLLQQDEKKIELEFDFWDGVQQAAFSPDGKLLALRGAMGLSGSTRGASQVGAVICDAATGKLLSQLLRHDECEWIGFDPASRWLVTAGNGFIQFWDVATGEPLGNRLEHPNVHTVAWSPRDSNLMLSSAYRGGVRLWNLGEHKLLFDKPWPHTTRDELADGTPRHDELAIAPHGRWFFQRTPDGLLLRDMKSGEALTDIISCVFAKPQLNYQELVKALGWQALNEEDFSAVAPSLAAAAEALSGFEVNEAGGLQPLKDRVAAFQAWRDIQSGQVLHAASAALDALLRQPQFRPMLDASSTALRASLAEGDAALTLTIEANRMSAPEGASPSSLTEFALRPAVAEANAAGFSAARRRAPVAAERMIRELLAGWSRRSDPLGALSAVRYGVGGDLEKARANRMLAEYERALATRNWADNGERSQLISQYKSLINAERALHLDPSRVGLADPGFEVELLELAGAGAKALMERDEADPTPLATIEIVREAYGGVLQFAAAHPESPSIRRAQFAELLPAATAQAPDSEGLSRRVDFAAKLGFSNPLLKIVVLRDLVLPYVDKQNPKRRELLVEFMEAASSRAQQAKGPQVGERELGPAFDAAREVLQTGADPELVTRSLGAFILDPRFPVELLPPRSLAEMLVSHQHDKEAARRDRVVLLLQQAIARGGESAEAQYVLGKLLAQQDKAENAALALKRARELLPPGDRRRAGYAKEEAAQWQEAGDGFLPQAQKAAEAGLQIAPEFVELRNLLGNILSGLKRDTAAEHEYRLVLETKGANKGALAEAHLGLAKCASARGKTAAAEQELEAALQAGGVDANLQRRVGWLAFNEKMFARMLACFKEANRAYEGKDEDVLAGLALAYQANGQKADAVSTYRKLVEADGKFKTVEEVRKLDWTDDEKAAMEVILLQMLKEDQDIRR